MTDETARERRRNTDEITHRLDAGDARMNELDAAVKENTKITEGIKSDTAEIVAFFHSMHEAFKVLNWIGALAKPLAYIAMLVSAFWGVVTLFKGGGGSK